MPPRATKAAEAAAIKPHTLVIDNGGSTIKAGFVSSNPALGDCRIIPNCIARDHQKRLYVGSELEACKDFYHAAHRRPVEKGMIVNWELQRAIWHQSYISEKNAILKVGA
jgi:actin-related protein 6